MKSETINMKAETYECLARDSNKVKHEFRIRKIQTSVTKTSRGASRDLKMCQCLDFQE